MDKISNKKFSIIVSLIICAIITFCSMGYGVASAFAVADYPDIYKDISMNFFKAQYEVRNIEYDNLEVALEADMYNNEDSVVAKAMVLQRDETYDYVILNLATSEIDEFVFDEPSALEKYSQKIYYTGAMGFFTKEQENYVHIETDDELTATEYETVSETINNELEETSKYLNYRITSNGSPLALTRSKGENGFYEWSTIKSFADAWKLQRTACGYLAGTDKYGTLDYCEDAYNGATLHFYNQNYFNKNLKTNKSCTPTALTNIFIWFQFRGYANNKYGVNALKENDILKTFDRFKVLTNHTDDGTKEIYIEEAIKFYLIEQGYLGDNNIRYVTAFNDFKGCIDNSMPILTNLYLRNGGKDGEDFLHSIVTVGYEVFTQYLSSGSYDKQFLRVVDGWRAEQNNDDDIYADRGRFIDFSGYYDDVYGWGINAI